jgi:hypothetical protein
MEKYGTQQKVLERALESLEYLTRTEVDVSDESSLHMINGAADKSTYVLHRDAVRVLFETVDIPRLEQVIIRRKGPEFIEFYFHKPLKKCSVKELVEGIVMTVRMTNLFDSVTYTEEADHYLVKISNSLGINNSIIGRMEIENICKSYGARCESFVSDMLCMTKIYKN